MTAAAIITVIVAAGNLAGCVTALAVDAAAGLAVMAAGLAIVRGGYRLAESGATRRPAPEERPR